MLQINPSLDDLVADAHAGIEDCFGVKAGTTAAAPGRVNLMGEHIDYCDGFVLPFAIDRHVVIAARSREDDEVRIFSDMTEETVSFHVGAPVEKGEGEWGNYIRGVARGFQNLGVRFCSP